MTKDIPADTVPLAFIDSKGAVKGKIDSELAITPAECKKGLSKRASLRNDRGMFFKADGPFWMKDVPFDLTLVSMKKSGEVVGLNHMSAQSLQLHFTPNSTKYTVEISPSLYKSANINVGDFVKVHTS